MRIKPLVLLFGALLFLSMLPVNVSASQAFPTIVNTSIGNSGAATTFHSIALPANRTVGDMLFACLSLAEGLEAITWPAGWIQVVLSAQSTNVLLSCDYHIVNGTEISPITVTSVSSVGSSNAVYLVQGFLVGSAPIPSVVAATTSQFPTTAAVQVPAEPSLVISGIGWKAGTASVSTYPGGFTLGQINDRWNNAGGTGAALSAKQEQTNLETPGSWAMSGSVNYVGYTFIVRPAAEVSTVPVDYTPLWIILAFFLILLGMGVVIHPVFQILAAFVGFALTFELLTLTGDVILSTVAGGMSAMVLITGALRDWR